MDDNFHGEFTDYCDYLDECLDSSEAEDSVMDGDHDSAMRDAGFGTDESYGLFDSSEDW